MSPPLAPYFAFNNGGFFALSSNDINDNTVFVLGLDGNLWKTPPPFLPNETVPRPGRGLIDENVAAFQVLPDGVTTFTLHSDSTLWYPPDRQQVDGNVRGFQALDYQTVLVLGTDGNLWWTPGGFGEVPQPNRALVYSNVIWYYGFSPSQTQSGLPVVFVLDNDLNVWCIQGPFERNGPVPSRAQVDGNARGFQALDSQTVYVLGTDGNLWYHPGPFERNDPVPNPNRGHVDANVAAYQAWDSQTVYALETNGNLWFIQGQFTPDPERHPPNRGQIDGNVAAFQTVDPRWNGVYTLGTDQNLWFNPGPFNPGLPIPNPNRGQVDGNVYGFQAADPYAVFVLGFDLNLWYTPGPFGWASHVPNPHRGQVDGSVAAPEPLQGTVNIGGGVGGGPGDG